jgi:EAL domain-containing protein (putative c-di-GMP-specific phosphodiesterase class I)
MPNHLSESSRAELLEEVGAALEQPFEVRGHRVILGTSFGFTDTAPQGVRSASDLLQQAEVALTTARQTRSGFAPFEPAQAQRIADRRFLDLALRRALAEEQFHLLFQPQIELRTGAMMGVEALVRWQHPDRGLVSPAQFIPLAEETGLIVELGDWVMRDACHQAAQWSWGGRVSVNVSSTQFLLGDVVETVRGALAASGLRPSALEIEITESVLLESDRRVLQALGELRALGVTVALDDFGTGYSSLSYLSKLPVDKLKIDQSFVRSLPDPHNEAIIEAIVTMAHQLGKSVVAEGIEMEAQRDYLAAVGCEVGQGYLFARPARADALGLLAATAA